MTFKRRVGGRWVVLGAALLSLSAQAKVRVLVTLPDFVEVVQGVGGDRVIVESLLSGAEDPHFVDAVPSFVSKVAKADVVCAAGLELEIGWLPKVLAKSANAKVQHGGTGFCELGRSVRVIEKASGVVDRSMGDVHAEGNPHFHLSPTALGESSFEVARVLGQVDPAGKLIFDSNAKMFGAKMKSLSTKIFGQLAGARDQKFIQFHKEFTYFFKEYELYMSGAIEEKPGVPPSSGRISAIAQEAKANKVVLAIGASYTSNHHLKKFSELSGVKAVRLPAGVQKNESDFNTIEKLQTHLARELLK